MIKRALPITTKRANTIKDLLDPQNFDDIEEEGSIFSSYDKQERIGVTVSAGQHNTYLELTVYGKDEILAISPPYHKWKEEYEFGTTEGSFKVETIEIPF